MLTLKLEKLDQLKTSNKTLKLNQRLSELAFALVN
jgi:hypothetical protein